MKRLRNAKKTLLLLIVAAFLVGYGCLPREEVKTENRVPVIESISHVKDVFSGVETELACRASDADADNLTYKWSADAGTIMGEESSIFWMPPDRLGTYNVTLAVTDGKGGEARETISIRVVTNADGSATPLIELKLKLGEPGTVVLDGQRLRIYMTTEIVCAVENAGDQQLTYKWSADSGKIVGKGVAEGTARKIGWIAPGLQTHSVVNVIVADNQGRQAAGQINIQVFCCGN